MILILSNQIMKTMKYHKKYLTVPIICFHGTLHIYHIIFHRILIFRYLLITMQRYFPNISISSLKFLLIQYIEFFFYILFWPIIFLIESLVSVGFFMPPIMEFVMPLLKLILLILSILKV